MSDRLIRKTEGIPAPDKNQIREIKKLLMWPQDKGFARCPAKVKKFIKDCEANNDFSHSGRNHICDECRCKKRAGEGTKGDFYGIGVETGHYGVGWCSSHDLPHPTVKNLEFADSELRLIQQVGDTRMDSEAHTKNAVAEAKMAQMSLRAREDLELVVDTLNDFKASLDVEAREEQEGVRLLKQILLRIDSIKVDDKDANRDIHQLISDAILERVTLTELSQGRPVPMTDKTRIGIRLDIAKTLSKTKLDHFKLDSNSYLHYDELKVRVPRMLNLGKNCFEELREMVMRNEENPVQQINEKWTSGLTSIWSDVNTGVKD